MTDLQTDSPAHLQKAPLGKPVTYKEQYDPSLLFPISRKDQRAGIGLSDELPFSGADVWYAYEVSWLNPNGKPEVALAEFTIPCDSPFIIESKSLKLFLTSLNGTKFAALTNVINTLARDLSKAAGATVDVNIQRLSEITFSPQLSHFSGECLDTLDVPCDVYTVHPEYLKCVGEEKITEVLYSNLLRSNCLKTGQPDWGSVKISYTGKAIDKPSLLQYIVSFRRHHGFGEDCVEQMFAHIMERCAPDELTVEARYTRRGGLDINPLRTNASVVPARDVVRLWRQ